MTIAARDAVGSHDGQEAGSFIWLPASALGRQHPDTCMLGVVVCIAP